MQFPELWIPFAVVEELAEHPAASSLAAIRTALKDWIHVGEAKDRELVKTLSGKLDRGESEAIALALEIHAEMLVIDEGDGRHVARSAGLEVTGVLGILLRSKEQGHITAVGPEIVKLRQLARFRVSPALEAQVLRLAGE
jgi:uncharacterized protein